MWRCGVCTQLIEDGTCQVNLCPIQLILKRLRFLVVGSDKVPVERANSVSPSSATRCPSSRGSCCCWCCFIMITRDSLVVVFLRPDESEENNIRHVSRVLSSPPTAVCFVFALISAALNLLSGSLGGYSRFTELNEKALGIECAALSYARTALQRSYFFILITCFSVMLTGRCVFLSCCKVCLVCFEAHQEAFFL